MDVNPSILFFDDWASNCDSFAFLSQIFFFGVTDGVSQEQGARREEEGQSGCKSGL